MYHLANWRCLVGTCNLYSENIEIGQQYAVLAFSIILVWASTKMVSRNQDSGLPCLDNRWCFKESFWRSFHEHTESSFHKITENLAIPHTLSLIQHLLNPNSPYHRPSQDQFASNSWSLASYQESVARGQKLLGERRYLMVEPVSIWSQDLS